MIRCYSYIRVSGKGQIDKEGPGRQREAIQAVSGVELLGEFFEKAVSGTIDSMDRPAFAEMIDAIECRRANGDEVAGFIVERADRLARDLMVSEMLFRECRKRGIAVYASDRELVDLASDDCDPTRKLIRQVMSALSEWSKSELVMKLRKSREAIKRRTGRCEGSKPYGHFPGEAPLVKYVGTIWDPSMSMRSVAELLNEAGFVTRKGVPWTLHNVKSIVHRAQQNNKEFRQWQVTAPYSEVVAEARSRERTE